MISAQRHDALVVGGGPAGAALARELAAAGRSVALLERDSETRHKVCGEFLSPEAIPLLAAAGVDLVSLGAQRIHALRIAGRDVIAEVELPEAGWALTRLALDQALLARAKDAGAEVLCGFNVQSLERNPGVADGGWQAQTSNTEHSAMRIQGGEAFLATGKHDLRGWARETKSTQSELVALKMYFALSPEQQSRLAGHVELIVYPGGYTGLQPVEAGRANLCVLIQRSKLQQLGGRWQSLLDYMQQHSTHLANRLSGARPLLARPLAISSIPYGFRAKQERSFQGPWRLGDQAAVIPSFCGDGMAIALDTAHRAAQMYLCGSSQADFQREVYRRISGRIRLATHISKLIVVAPWITQVAGYWPPVIRKIFTATRVTSTAT
jgi:flavin-dependent dehydrogenase